ncbi:MAG TPA: sigma-70 family RNA polymerase sigma factor [Phycisphaerae bacterium]
MKSARENQLRAALTAAFLASYERLANAIQRRIPAKLRGALSTDDFLQEVWIEAARALARPARRPPDDFERWFATLGSRKLHESLRSRQTQKRGGRVDTKPIDSAAEALAAAASAVWRRAAQAGEVTDAVNRAIRGLKPAQRAALRLWMAGLSDRQIAEKLDTTPAAVNSVLFHARRELRAPLARALEIQMPPPRARSPTRKKPRRGRAR